MDWGILDENAGENKFLREEIVYAYKVLSWNNGGKELKEEFVKCWITVSTAHFGNHLFYNFEDFWNGM